MPLVVNVTKIGTFKNVVAASLLFLFHDRLSMETNSLIQPHFDYCSVVWERPGVRTGPEASKNSKTSYDHKFSAGYASSTALPLQKLGQLFQTSSRQTSIMLAYLNIFFFVWYLGFLTSFYSILHMLTRSERIINIHIKHYINKPRLWKRSIKLLVIEMIKVYNTLAPECLWQKFLKLRTTYDTTKSIMAKNVLVIGWG